MNDSAEDPGADHSLTELLHGQMPLARSLGVTARSGSADAVETRAQWDERWCTTGGVMHGGFLMAMADATGAVCAVFNLPAGAITSTIESKTNFFRPVVEGVLTATATPVHTGRTTIVVQTDITRGDGKLASRTVQTQAVIPTGT